MQLPPLGSLSVRELPHYRSTAVWTVSKLDPRTDAYDARQDRLYRYYLGFTIAGVVGAIAGVIAICLQTGAILRSTKAAEIAANAAQRSAEVAARNADVTEEALRLSERAEVLLDGANVHLSGPEAKHFDLHAWLELTIKNFGRTKAIDVTGDFKLDIQDLSCPIIRTPPTVLGAGQTQSIAFPRFSNLFDTQSFDAALRGERKLRFSGIFNYSDVFGTHYTGQCVGTFDNGTRSIKIDQNS